MMTALVYNPETARSLGFGEYVQDPQQIFCYAGRDTRLTDISGIRLCSMDPTNFGSLWQLKAQRYLSLGEIPKIHFLKIFF